MFCGIWQTLCYLVPPRSFSPWTTVILWRSQNMMGPDWGTPVPWGPSHMPAPYGSLRVRKRSLHWQKLPSAAGTCWWHAAGSPWPHVLPAGLHAGSKKGARPPAERAFTYFLSWVALMKISMYNFLTGKVQPIEESSPCLWLVVPCLDSPLLWPGGPWAAQEMTWLNFH